MSSVEDIENAVENLPPAELARFRAWFEAFDAELFDRKIEAGTAAGRLDRLAEQALQEHRAGHTREL